MADHSRHSPTTVRLRQSAEPGPVDRSFLVVPYRQYRSHSLKDFHLFYSFLVSHLHLNHRLQVGLSIVQTGIAVSGDHSCLGPPPPKSWASRCLISSRVGSSICVAIAQLNPNGSLTRP